MQYCHTALKSGNHEYQQPVTRRFGYSESDMGVMSVMGLSMAVMEAMMRRAGMMGQSGSGRRHHQPLCDGQASCDPAPPWALAPLTSLVF